MAFPLAVPTVNVASAVTIRARSVVGMSASPLSLAQNVYVHQGACWELDVSLPPMKRSDAEEWLAFLLELNGREGTFLIAPDPINVSPRGTWDTGAPLVNGASQTGKSLIIDGIAGKTAKKGDWFQLGSGSSSHLHKLTDDLSGNGTLSIWPRLRTSPADNAALTVSSPKGLFRLSSNVREWTLELAAVYGIKFSAIEAL